MTAILLIAFALVVIALVSDLVVFAIAGVVVTVVAFVIAIVDNW